MTCPRCQHANRAGAKFCEECATPLTRTCAQCGSAVSPTASSAPNVRIPSAGLPWANRDSPHPNPTRPRTSPSGSLTSKSALEGERKALGAGEAALKFVAPSLRSTGRLWLFWPILL